MTTIATDGKTMAGDGQRELCRTIVDTSAKKVRRLSDGRLFGSSGESAFAEEIIAWLEGNAEKPTRKPDDGFNGLVLNADGTVEAVTESCVLIRISVPTAIGSGMDFAIGAMEAGKSPKEAVEIAARRDPSTGGTITELRFDLRAVA